MYLEIVEKSMDETVLNIEFLKEHLTENEILEFIKGASSEQIINKLIETKDEDVLKYILFAYQHPFKEEELLRLLDSDDKYLRFKSCEKLSLVQQGSSINEKFWIFIRKVIGGEVSYDEIKQAFYFIATVLCSKDGWKKENMGKINFCKDEGMMSALCSFINVRDVQYQVLLVVWVLSFEKETEKYLEEAKVYDSVVRIIRERQKEKVLRICFGVVRNYIEFGFKFSICKAYDIITSAENLLSKKPADLEFMADLEVCHSALSTYLKNSSSVDNYLSELFEGKLEESPFHYCDVFWEANINVLLENKVEIIKVLKKYLRSHNTTWLCVAANDVYRFLKAAPEISPIVVKYNLKDDLFNLTGSINEDIRFHAIQALAVCIFSEWN